MTDVWHERLQKDSSREGDHRDPFQRDRARVIHSAAFRRLQSKTQVFGVGESDYYRTRLTHSLEVAQIGAGIVGNLRNRSPEHDALYPTQDLIETISYAHDIGHPPFGHGGEVALNFVMCDVGGFEGNGQTLRILSRLGKMTANGGLNLTRRALLGVLKYPGIYSQVVNYDAYVLRKQDEQLQSLKGRLSSNIFLQKDAWKPPKCIFDDEADVLEWLLLPLSDEDKGNFLKLADKGPNKHLKPACMAFDTSILELSDDIAYGVHDLEDAIALDQVARDEWQEAFAEFMKRSVDRELGYGFADLSEDLFSGEHWKRKRAIGSLVNYLITAVQVDRTGQFEEPLLDAKAILPDDHRKFLDKLQAFTVQKVIKRPEVQRLEFKGQKLVIDLFRAFITDPDRLLAKPTLEWVSRGIERGESTERVVCDYLSGMTDTYAEETYLTMFHPTAGSIFKKI